MFFIIDAGGGMLDHKKMCIINLVILLHLAMLIKLNTNRMIIQMLSNNVRKDIIEITGQGRDGSTIELINITF